MADDLSIASGAWHRKTGVGCARAAPWPPPPWYGVPGPRPPVLYSRYDVQRVLAVIPQAASRQLSDHAPRKRGVDQLPQCCDESPVGVVVDRKLEVVLGIELQRGIERNSLDHALVHERLRE